MKKAWIGFLAYTLLSSLMVGSAFAWTIKLSHWKQIINIDTEALVSANALYQKGITKLKPEKQNFTKNITRLEGWLMISRLFNQLNNKVETTLDTSCNFTDLAQVKNFEDKINIIKLCENEIMKGYADGSFGVSDQLTRGQTVLILARMLYPDKIATLTMDEAYSLLLLKGIIKQDDRGTESLNKPITREALIVMLNRSLKQDKIEDIIIQSSNAPVEEGDNEKVLKKVFNSINSL